MRYKVLLTGKNDSAIDDFFMQMKDNFEVVTTSARFEDIMRHITYFSPDLFVYCLYNEAREDMIQIAGIKFKLSQANIPLIVIGLKEDCDEFEKIAVNVANMTLYRPLSVGVIQDKLIGLLKERKFLEVINTQFEEELAEKQSQPEAPANASAGAPAASSKVQVSLRRGQPQRKHVLVVDDNAMMLKVIKEHLHEKYDVATAVSGKVALKFLERKKTDLILLDYEMPDESGPVILEKLRSMDETKDIPVIFLTGVTESKKIKEALALKPQSYLLKPIDRDKLLDTIGQTIG